MTLASSPRGDKRGVTLVMAGFTPNAVHPHGGRSASYFASKAACTAPPCLGPRKPRSSQPPLPDCPSAGGKDTIPPATESPENRPVTFPAGRPAPCGPGATRKMGPPYGVCASPGGPPQSKPVYVQNLLLPVFQCRPGRFHLIEPEFGSLPLFVGQVSGIWVLDVEAERK